MNNAPLPANTPATMTDWDNEPSLSQLQQDYDDAKIENDKHVINVERWLDNLNITGSAKITTPDGKSSMQPKLIRKQNEWRYPSLSEPFLSTPDLFNAYPKGHRDRDSAYQNQLVLNHQFNTQIGKTKFINDFVHTVVDEGTVVTCVGWDYADEEVEVEQPIIEYVLSNDPAYIQELQQHIAMAQEAPEQFTSLPPEVQQAVQMSMQSGQPVQGVVTGYETVIETRVIRNQPSVDVCDFRTTVIDPTCNGDLSKAKFVVKQFTTSIEDLQQDGKYTNLDKITHNTRSIIGDENYYSEDNSAFNFEGDKRKKFTAHEYWGYWDTTDEGNLTPIVATWVGDTLIRLEKSPFPFRGLPFDSAALLHKTKSVFGEPDAELIEDNQKIIGAVTRGMIDILAANAQGQKGSRQDALTMLNKRKYQQGDDYEFLPNADPRQAFYVHTAAEIPPSAQYMLQQQTNEAESMNGVKAFSNGISGQALGDTATGVRGALDAASKRELGILRRLADCMVNVGRKIMAMNAEFLSDEEIIRVTDTDFIAIKRDDLAGDFDVRLSISTAEEDNAKAQELSFMLQTTGNNMDEGLRNIILSDIARLRKMPALAERIESYKPEPDPIQQEMAQLELELKRAELAETQARTQELLAQAGLHAAKAEESESKADLYNLDFIEQEGGVKQERDLQKQGAQAEANAKLEQVKALLNPKGGNAN